jgi:hypothetical protein
MLHGRERWTLNVEVEIAVERGAGRNVAQAQRIAAQVLSPLLPKGLIRPVSAIGRRYVMAAGMRFQYQTIAV